MTFRALRLLILALILFPLGACSDNDYGDSDEVDRMTVASTAASSPKSSTSEFFLPDSTVTLTLSTPFAFDSVLGRVEPSLTDLPFPPETVTVRWFQQLGLYVAYFEGLPSEDPICLATWVESGSKSEYSSNSPSRAGGCVVQTEPPTGVYLCEGGRVLFLTQIPTTTEGVLFANARQFVDDRIDGLEGSVPSDIANTPEIDLSSCVAPKG
jgi:hypothetical protein